MGMKRSELAVVALIFMFVAAGVALNLREQKAVDMSKLPQKVEQFRQFQRWITNLKNKDLIIEADEFRMIEDVEIYNTKWMKVYSLDEPGKRAEFENYLLQRKNTEKIVFSPSELELIDYRNISRDGYLSNEAHFYGQKEDKIVDARVLDCSTKANCYFDRAYFLSNDLFVITEISRNINKKDPTTPNCATSETCMYTFKLHLVDLINNSRLVYESKPFEAVLDQLIPKL